MIHLTVAIEVKAGRPGGTDEEAIVGMKAGEMKPTFGFSYRNQASADRHLDRLKRSYPGRRVEFLPAQKLPDGRVVCIGSVA